MSSARPFSEILMSKQKKNTEHAVKTAKDNYQTPWIVIHESLQNSLDAIYESGETGNITIILDADDQSVKIRDDGVGFPHGDDGLRLLGLHGTNKDGDTRQGGNLGYGIKTVICSTSVFRLQSVRDGSLWGFEIEDGHNINNSSFYEFSDKPSEKAESGTSAEYSFPNHEVSEAINEIYESTPGIQKLNNYDSTVQHISEKDNYVDILKSLFEWYFRTKTYAANIDRLINGEQSNVPKVDISFKIKAESKEGREEINEDVDDVVRLNNSTISVDFENKYWDVEDIFLKSNEDHKAGLPFTLVNDVNIPIPDTLELKSEQVLIFKFTSEEEYDNLVKYPSGKYAGEVDGRGEGYYDGKLFHVMEGFYMVIGRKRYLDMMMFPNNPERKTTFARGIPTQDYITMESGKWGSSRSESTVAAGIHVSDKLNLGKLQLSYRKRVNWIREFYTDAFKAHFKRISSQVARKEVTEEEDLNLPGDGDESTEYVDRPTIFEPGHPERGVIVEPKYENELIALFFDLVGRGFIDGYQFYGLSGSTRHDGKTEIKKPTRDYFRSSITQDSKLCDVEFKTKLSKLANELENRTSRKRASQLQLAIVWEIDEENISNEHDYKVVQVDNFGSLSGMDFPDDKVLSNVENILGVRVEQRFLPIQVLEVKSVVSSIVEDG